MLHYLNKMPPKEGGHWFKLGKSYILPGMGGLSTTGYKNYVHYHELPPVQTVDKGSETL